MKKIIVVILSLLILTGCNKQIEKYYLSDEYYNEYNLIELDDVSFSELENSKDSFALLVYSTGCTACSSFESFVDSFLKDNNLTFYKMNYNVMKTTDINNKVKYAPSVVLFKDGKIVEYLDANCNDDTVCYESKENFAEWFNKYVYVEKDA